MGLYADVFEALSKFSLRLYVAAGCDDFKQRLLSRAENFDVRHARFLYRGWLLS